MSKGMLLGTILGATVVTAGASYAGYEMLNKGPQFAQVTNVTEVTKTVKTPRQECHNETVTHRAAVKDENRIAGSVIGAVLGGVIGKQVGGGNGKKIATVAGVAGGAYAGNQIQKGMQERDTYTTTERRCKTVHDSRQDVIGYDVNYTLNGTAGKVRMDHDPGTQIPVENGLLVLTQRQATASVVQ